MRLVLAIPGLVVLSAEGSRAPNMPALARLLAAAGPPLREPEGIGAMLAPHYGVERQADWPFAPLRLAELGIDPGDAYWLAADPIALVAGRDDVRFGGRIDDLTANDAERLLATLDRHFAADGLAFVAPRADAWFVRVPLPTRLVTHSLDTLAGQALRALLPEGPDASRWRRWHSEIQMLFHEHPVNLERERSGRAPVTGVWFSCGGILPPRASSAARIRTWANGGIATALARHADAAARPLPADFPSAMRETGEVVLLVVALDATIDRAAIESAWGAPAWSALATGEIDAVTLITDGAGQALAFTAHRPRLWQRVRQRFAEPDFHALLAAIGPGR